MSLHVHVQYCMSHVDVLLRAFLVVSKRFRKRPNLYLQGTDCEEVILKKYIYSPLFYGQIFKENWTRYLCAKLVRQSQICINVHRVRTGPGKPGKSWNFVMEFSRTGKSWKKATDPGKSWKSV